MKTKMRFLILLLLSLTLIINSSIASGSITIDAPITISTNSLSAIEWYADAEARSWLTTGMCLDTFKTMDDYAPEDLRDFWGRPSWVGIYKNKQQLKLVGYYTKEANYNIISMVFNPSTEKIQYSKEILSPGISKDDVEEQCEAILSNDNEIDSYVANDLHEIWNVLSGLGLTSYENLADVRRDIISDVCSAIIDKWKNNTEWTSLMGNPYINQIFCIRDDDIGLFYIKVLFDFDQGETTSSSNPTFYFKVSHFGYTQLSEPVLPIDDNDWILLNQFSEIECYKTAEEKFYDQRWKDPTSVTVYGHTTSYSDKSFTFAIDYSAKNSFGGNTRDTHYVVVDFETNTAISSF